MKKLLIVSVYLMIAGVASAQFQVDINANDSTWRNLVSVDAGYNIASNAVTSAFMSDYYMNRYLGSVKGGVMNKLKNNNRLGGDADISLDYRHRKFSASSKNNHTFYIAVKSRNHTDGIFSGDIFKLYFNGNREFENQTVHADGLQYRLLQYTQLETGKISEFYHGDKKFSVGFGLAAIAAQNHFDLDVENLSLFTATDGEYLEGSAKFLFRRSDTASKSLSAVNGWGASASLFLTYTSGNNHLYLGISDAGFLLWNKNSITVKSDSAFKFEGLDVENLFDSLNIGFSDSALTMSFLNQNIYGSYMTPLPSWIHLSWRRNFPEELFSFTAGIKYRLMANYFPLVYIKGNYGFTPKFRFALQVQAGGYGVINTGVELEKDFGKGFIITANTWFLEGYIFPDIMTSQGAFVSVRKYF